MRLRGEERCMCARERERGARSLVLLSHLRPLFSPPRTLFSTTQHHAHPRRRPHGPGPGLVRVSCFLGWACGPAPLLESEKQGRAPRGHGGPLARAPSLAASRHSFHQHTPPPAQMEAHTPDTLRLCRMRQVPTPAAVAPPAPCPKKKPPRSFCRRPPQCFFFLLLSLTLTPSHTHTRTPRHSHGTF